MAQFELSGKAVSVMPAADDYLLEDGDLIIKGLAANFEGVDRQGENFTDGAFADAIAEFLEGNPALCYHHRTGDVLGRVLELEEVPGVGLHMVARVDGAIKNDPKLGAIYRQIRKGSVKGLSVGGYFGRTMTAAGPRISRCSFTEVSVTPVPSLAKGTAFSVVAGKAEQQATLARLDAALDRLELAFVLAELRSM